MEGGQTLFVGIVDIAEVVLASGVTVCARLEVEVEAADDIDLSVELIPNVEGSDDAEVSVRLVFEVEMSDDVELSVDDEVIVDVRLESELELELELRTGVDVDVSLELESEVDVLEARVDTSGCVDDAVTSLTLETTVSEDEEKTSETVAFKGVTTVESTVPYGSVAKAV